MNKNNLNIVFFGTPDFAVPALKLLIEDGHNVSAVFTGQGPIKILAQEHEIKIFQPISLKKDELTFEEFKNLKPDICIVAAYGKILPQKFLDIPRYGFLNIHPSLLPKYRGPSPIQTTILNGDKETGVSIMLVDAEVDHGPILAKREFPILNFQFSNHDELAKELFKLGAELLVEILPKYISGEIKPVDQDHSQAKFTKMFTRDDGRINWDSPAQEIYNHIRALNPEPGTWTTWKPGSESSRSPEGAKLKNTGTSTTRKGKVINISNITTSDVVSPQAPGTVVEIDHNIAVATKKCYLILKQIQLEGGKKMDAKSFVNGHPDFLRSVLE